jgi:hypothetical protein
MIGFIDRAAIPKMVIGFIVGVLVLVVGISAVSFLPIHGDWLAVAFIVAFAVAFKAGEWAGGAIWNRIQSR